MPTVFTHAVAALALGPSVQRTVRPLRLWALGAACAVAPDLDVLAFRFGIPYRHPFGHRGASHSLVFAAALAAVVVIVFFRRSDRRAALWAYVFAATASHGLLDMLTNGGRGVALAWPFSNARLFFPWRPIEVSPIGASRFFSARGLGVLASEVVWVWGPAIVVALVLIAVRRRAPAPHGT